MNNSSSDLAELAACCVEELDARGLRCPEPVMLLHKVVKRVAQGAVIRVLADDPATERDIPRFCEFLSHELLAREDLVEECREYYSYWIRTRVKS